MIYDFIYSIGILGCTAVAFGLLAGGAHWVIKKVKQRYLSNIPPYLMGEPMVTWAGPIKNRMRHVLSF